jgi:hypothetical protein
MTIGLDETPGVMRVKIDDVHIVILGSGCGGLNGGLGFDTGGCECATGGYPLEFLLDFVPGGSSAKRSGSGMHSAG